MAGSIPFMIYILERQKVKGGAELEIGRGGRGQTRKVVMRMERSGRDQLTSCLALLSSLALQVTPRSLAFKMSLDSIFELQLPRTSPCPSWTSMASPKGRVGREGGFIHYFLTVNYLNFL